MLDELLKGSGLAEKAVKIDDKLVRLQWGSAFVIAGISGSAVVAISPLFRSLPPGKELAFMKKLLEHNAYMGGIASFALQPDGWIVLHAGRALKGIDAQEFATLIAGVGRFADQFDDQLVAEFYADNRAAVASQAGAEASGQFPQTD
jgi:hypothetical protein